jgi:hypothetical protein
MILYSESGKATATAHLLQAIVAIPRMKALAENLQAIPSERSGMIQSTIGDEADLIVMNYIWEIVKREAYSDDSFMAVDEVAVEISGTLSSHNELPPLPRVRGMWTSPCSARRTDLSLRSMGSSTARRRGPILQRLTGSTLQVVPRRTAHTSTVRRSRCPRRQLTRQTLPIRALPPEE